MDIQSNSQKATISLSSALPNRITPGTNTNRSFWKTFPTVS